MECPYCYETLPKSSPTKYVLVYSYGGWECSFEDHIPIIIDEDIEDIKKDFKELCWKTYNTSIEKDSKWDTRNFNYGGQTFDAHDYIVHLEKGGVDYFPPEIYTVEDWFNLGGSLI